jgi:predicted nucleic-acid-binding Zn-ribbon protein
MSATSSKKDPQTVEVKGKPLVCPICGNNHFWLKKILLNTAALTFLDLDWANRRANCFICSECTFIYWFQG